MSDEKQVILVVDDEPVNIIVLSDLLKEHYRVIAARNGEQALQRTAGELKPDLILLDIMMPDMDGLEVCRRLKSEPETADIPVIFVTAMNDEVDEMQGLRVGAVDYITKPISPPIVLARVNTHLTLKRAQNSLKAQNKTLEIRVNERTHEVALTQDVTILAMATLAETRDNETGNHIRRTQHYVKALALALVERGHYTEELTEKTIELLYKSAPLHDIGKVGIPDSILLKPGKLTDEEFEIMKGHARLGRDAIYEAEQVLGDKSFSFLRYAREIAHYHHEKWDGSGYPEGLSGFDIPLSGRLMAVADVYDALISKRVYKPPFTHERAMEIILSGRDKHFDPIITDVFEEISEQFREIALTYQD